MRALYLILLVQVLAFGAAPASNAAPFKLPPVQELKSSQGIKLFFMQQSEVPLLHISIGLQGGSSLDDVNGLAAFTAEALKLGTRSYKKAELEQRLDFLGATLETDTQDDFTSIELSLASSDVETLLPILAEIVTAPTFPENEILKLKERSISELKKRRESPSQVAEQYFNRLAFGVHPYAHPALGSPLSISRITRASVVSFYQKTFSPDRAAISVVGKFDPAALEKLINASFASWAAKPELLPLVTAAPPATDSSPKVLLVNKGDATETTFRIGGLGVPRSSPDWISLQVINTILGGRFTSWLNEELRIKTGLTYGAKSRFDAMKNGGTFAIASFTANENSFKALDLALSTYQRFSKEGFNQETLDSAKAYVKGQFPPRYETLESLSGFLIEKWIYGLPSDVIDRFESEVDALTLERSRALIQKYFPQKLDILLIGKAAELRSGASKYGRVIQTDVERIDDLSALSEAR